jgi:hypothetical protein
MRIALTIIAGLVAAAVLAPVCFFAALILAGPHSSLLPSFIQPVVLVVGWIIFLATPMWIASRVWRRLTPAPPPARLSFDQWLAFSDRERYDILSRWNCYGGQGRDIVEAATEHFRGRYGHLPGLHINNPGVYHGGYWVIHLVVPEQFDRSQLPSEYLGINVHTSLRPSA